MSMSIDPYASNPNASFSISGIEARRARGLQFNLKGQQGTWEPEPSEEEIAAAEAQPLTPRRELSEEEKARVEYLQNQLESLLQDLADNPSKETKARIRDIESELEKITGIKTRSQLTKMADRMPGQDEDDKDEKRTTRLGVRPLEEEIAAHTLPDGHEASSSASGSGVLAQMLRAAGAYGSMSLAGTKFDSSSLNVTA